MGICALTEVESTLEIVRQILTMYDPGIFLKELIVATPNRHIAEKLENRDSRIIIILEEKREGKAPALRKILQRATGDILVQASADIKLGPRSIQQLVHALASNETWGAVDSHVELLNYDIRLADRISTLLWEIHNEMLERLDREGRLGHLAGDLFAVRRDLITKIPDTINDDAYIALQVQRKGYAVRRAQNALVWILGPRNPADYVSQRSRILLGHLKLIKEVGTMPTTFEFTLLRRPLRNLRVLNWVLLKLGSSYVPTLLAGMLLELVSFQMAVVQLFTRGNYRPWRIAHSTKRV